MKAKKILTGSVAGFVALIAAALWLINATGNAILARVISNAVGTPVAIHKFHLRPTEVGIFGLAIKNPSGFKEPMLAFVPEIFVRYDLMSFFKKKVHIREIRLNLDQITIEKNRAGAVNVMQITARKGMEKRSAGRKPPTPPEKKNLVTAKKKESMDVQIDQLILNLGRARYADYSMGEPPRVTEYSLEMRNIPIHDLSDPAQIIEQIVFRVLQKMGLKTLGVDLGDFQNSLESQISDKLNQIKGLFSQLAHNL